MRRTQHNSQFKKKSVRNSIFFAKLAEFVLRRRWSTLLVCALITALAVEQIIQNLKLENSIEKVVATDAEPRRIVQELRGTFGMDALYQVLVKGDVFTPDFLEKLKKLHEEIAAIDIPLESVGGEKEPSSAKSSKSANDGHAELKDPFAGFDEDGADDGWGDESGGTVFEEVTSLINVRDTRWRDGVMSVGGLLDEWPRKSELEELKRKVLSDPNLVGRVVGPRGDSAVIVMKSVVMEEKDSTKVYDEVARIAIKYQSDDFSIQIAGMPTVGVALNKAMLADIWWMVLLSSLALLLVVAYIFRHWLGIIGPVLVVVQGIIWTIGLMAWLGVPLTVVTSILPGFIVCVGVGDAIHIQSVYRDKRRRGESNRQSIVGALASTGIPVLLTTVTTCIGLLSFRFATLHTVRELGTFGAMGVLAALLLSLMFLPAVLSFNEKSLLGARPEREGKDLLDRFLHFLCNISKPRLRGGHRTYGGARRVVLACVVIAVLAVVGGSLVRVSYDPIRWLPDDDATRAAFSAIDEHVGGTSSVALLIEAKPGRDLRDREFLLALAELEEHIKRYRDPDSGESIVGEPISILDIVKESSRALNRNDPAFYKIPDSERGVADMFTAFESSASSELRQLATLDMTKSVVLIPVRWMDAWKYRPLTDYISNGIERTVGKMVDVKVTGTVYTVLTIVNALVTDLMRSFGTAFAIITIVMIILLGDLKLGLVGMVPNLLPIAAVMGIMGFIDLPLDVVTLLVGSVGIGIAVDDTIHFLYQFKKHFKEHEDVEGAIGSALSHAGRAMAATSAILIQGHLVFIVASMSHIRTFGVLIAVVVAIAFFMDLIFTPALVRFLYTERTARSELYGLKRRLAATFSAIGTFNK